jgi:hypothetical protein
MFLWINAAARRLGPPDWTYAGCGPFMEKGYEW